MPASLHARCSHSRTLQGSRRSCHGGPVSRSPRRGGVEREPRRRNASGIISTLLALALVGTAVAAVISLVVLNSLAAVDSSERREAVGTAIAAPMEPLSLPTLVPAAEPEPAALEFSGDRPAIAALPTVATSNQTALQETGPTPTPRIMALPMAVPPTLPVPAPTPPPPAPVVDVPVVALAPVEGALPAPAGAPDETALSDDTQLASAPQQPADRADHDPFAIFEEGQGPRIVAAQDEALERARALREDPGRPSRTRRADRPAIAPTIPVPDAGSPSGSLLAPPVIPMVLPDANVPTMSGPDQPITVDVPDADTMIDEITARVKERTK